jgi:hypothetical protein
VPKAGDHRHVAPGFVEWILIRKDERLYEYLALVDAVRIGNQREVASLPIISSRRSPRVGDREPMTEVRAQLLEMLKAVAIALGDDLRSRLVFVGGCTTALFITDPITLEDVCATEDIDLIVDLAGLPAWADLQGNLRQRGFMEAADEAVICRMRLGKLKVDFMPDDAAILGFSNRWYAKGIKTAVQHPLSPAPASS